MPKRKSGSQPQPTTKNPAGGIRPKTLTADTARRVRGGQGDPKKGGMGGGGGGKGI